jgi:SAM-dependent methyltransferase
VPPRALSFIGGGDFRRTGTEYLGLFEDPGGLRPTDRVLDVGCGVGRMAIPLTEYLDGGSYAGFDVGRSMIRWCERHVSTRRSDFTFTWAPVYNRKYNPFGDIPADDFRFPYEDASFDFVFATSLFTHLTRSDAEHYLRETRRVLRPGGRCLLTFFLLHEQSSREVAAGRAAFNFQFPVEGGRTIDRHEPEAAIAFELDALRLMFEETGLEICEPVHFGRWSNNPGGLSGQDVVIARDRGSSPSGGTAS